MALPKLTITLFPPRKEGSGYAASGHLTIPLRDVHALAEWLLGQPGEYNDYLRDTVVRLQAFEYHNTSRGGNPYRTVQLKESGDRPGPGAPPAPGSLGAPQPALADAEIPF